MGGSMGGLWGTSLGRVRTPIGTPSMGISIGHPQNEHPELGPPEWGSPLGTPRMGTPIGNPHNGDPHWAPPKWDPHWPP